MEPSNESVLVEVRCLNRWLSSAWCFLLVCMLVQLPSARAQDVLRQRLNYPENVNGPPAAGKRVAVTPQRYKGTDVHHMLYLPEDWTRDFTKRNASWPVVVEYTGNHYPQAGSTGRVEDARLGYGVSGGEFIWVTLPFVAENHRENAVRWWGDERATVDYAVENVPAICSKYGGDPDKVILCGFSRGAIAASYIGLHDDRISKLWCGLLTHDHFDGIKEWKNTKWGTPLEKYRSSAIGRLSRLDGRPVLVCQAGGTDDIRSFLQPYTARGSVSYITIDPVAILGGFPNKDATAPHNDRWLVAPSEARTQVWRWTERVLDRI